MDTAPLYFVPTAFINKCEYFPPNFRELKDMIGLFAETKFFRYHGLYFEPLLLGKTI
jgi:hypothetical protein